MSIEDLGPDLATPFNTYGKSFLFIPAVRVNKYFLLVGLLFVFQS